MGGVAALCILAGLTLWLLRRKKTGHMRQESYPHVNHDDMNQVPIIRQTPELANPHFHHHEMNEASGPWQTPELANPHDYHWEMNGASGPRQTPELADEQARLNRIELDTSNRDMQDKFAWNKDGSPR